MSLLGAHNIWLDKKGVPCGEYVRPEACILLVAVSMGSIYVWARSGMLTIMDKAMVSLPSMPSTGGAEIGLLEARHLTEIWCSLIVVSM